MGNMEQLLFELIRGFWIIIPAYVANAAAPFSGGKRRIDFGRDFFGREFLGAGKTWEGLSLAVLLGTFCGWIEVAARPHLNPIALQNGFSLQFLTLTVVFSIALGAMLGDIVASFFKRRLGFKRGESAPLLDQLDFLLGGFLAASLFVPVSLLSVAIFVIITPAVHYLSNYIGYKTGISDVPW